MPFGVGSCEDSQGQGRESGGSPRLQCLSAWGRVRTMLAEVAAQNTPKVSNAFRRGVV